MTKYQWLQNYIQDEFGYYYDRYPYFMMLLDLPIRHYITRKGNQIQINSVKRLVRKYTNKNTNIKKVAKKNMYNIYKYLSPILATNGPKIAVLGGWGRFNLLLESIKNVSPEPTYNLLYAGNMGHIRYNLKGIPLGGFLENNLLDDFIMSLQKNYDPKTTLNNYSESKIETINKYLKNENNKLAKRFDKEKINLIIASNDQHFEQQFICKASEKAEIPYYVIAHGYSHGGYFIGAMPIRADKLFVWDDPVKEKIVKENQEYYDKLNVFGYPKYDKKYVRDYLKQLNEDVNNKEKSVLFVSQPFEEVGKPDFRRKEIYNEMKKHSEENEVNVTVRLHGKERDNKEKISQINKFGFNYSEEDLLDDILLHDYLIGFKSSVLFEAKVIKGSENVYKISDYNDITNIYPEIEEEYISEIFKKLKDMNKEKNILSGNELIDDFEEYAAEVFF